MLSGISGVVYTCRGQALLVRVGQLTFNVEMPVVQAAELRPGDEVDLHTYLHFSSSTDQLRLFGFTSAVARDLFVTLISGPGVGPRVALSLLELEVPGLVAAIIEENEKTLTSVPGVGPKLARKIILELSGKVTRDFAAEASAAAHYTRRGGNVEDALEAVVALGFARLQAEQALAKTGKHAADAETADLIRLILAQLSRA